MYPSGQVPSEKVLAVGMGVSGCFYIALIFTVINIFFEDATEINKSVGNESKVTRVTTSWWEDPASKASLPSRGRGPPACL